jgi:predicted phosphodiesterase
MTAFASIEPPFPVVTVEASQLKERVLIVGDVHGCLDELKALLEKANYAAGRTSVVLVGDVCNKGPHSAATVAFCRQNNFLCVRGNHDHSALKVRLPLARHNKSCRVTAECRHSIAWGPSTATSCPTAGSGSQVFPNKTLTG